jgi:hypothetical protein
MASLSVPVLDFAGGLVVHVTCGAAALAAILVIGPRKGYGRDSFMPHNLPMTMLGTGSAGSVSTAAVPWQRTEWQPLRLSPLI